MGLVVRKPVFAVGDMVRLNLAYSLSVELESRLQTIEYLTAV